MPDIVYLESNISGSGELFFTRAASLGLRPILFSRYPEWYRSHAAFEQVKLVEMTEDAVLEAIDRLGRDRVAGVWSSLDDWVELAARVSSTLGLPGVDPAGVAACHDKFTTRQALAEAGIRDVGFALARSGDEAEAAARGFSGKVVMKPRRGAGSAGVQLCGAPEEARRHFEELADQRPETRDEGALVEALVDGPQFSVEVFDGRSIGVTRQHIGPAPSFIPIGHDFPCADDPRIRDAVAAHAERAVAAVGHRRGPANVDLRCGEQGPCIIEINRRLAGGMIPVNIHLATGVDLIEATIRFACGMPYDLSRRRDRAIATRWLLRSGPPARDVLGREAAANVPGVVKVEVEFFRDRFGRKGPASDFQDRIGYVVSEAGTALEAIRIAELGLRKLRILPDRNWRRAGRWALSWVGRGIPPETALGSKLRVLRHFSLASRKRASKTARDGQIGESS